MKKFSIVMGFRNTEREIKFSTKSIPSAIRLEPEEILIGVDAPAKQDFLNHIHGLFEEHGFKKYSIIEIQRNNDWNFQLAHIIWNLYTSCKNDKILAFDVDTVLKPAVLRGYDLVGQDSVAVVSL